MKHNLTIRPAIPPVHRHEIEHVLTKLGYKWIGGGQMIDGSESDISFESLSKIEDADRIDKE